MLRTLGLVFSLFMMWWLLSGHPDPLLLTLGVLAAVFAVLVASRMRLIDHEGFPIQLGWRILLYWPWLIRAIVRANIDVARIILAPRLRISPTVRRLPCGLGTGLAQAIYANSITLTPGTVCLRIDDSQVEIHALTTAMADDVASGEMEARVRAVTDRH